MQTKNSNLLVIFLFTLMLGFWMLVASNFPEPVQQEPQTQHTTVVESGETLIISPEPIIVHLGYLLDDYRQEIVQEAYLLGGLEFVSLLECENGQRLTGAVGDYGQSHGLCQLNTRRHKEPLLPEWNDWRYQLSVCYAKWKTGTKFSGPQRIIQGKRCSEYVKSRFKTSS